ncbi:hypothetical protein B0H10DRAFT_1949938 [Mycena sp. CBHHK59/15]|nr:hypothetical protein B0H10DRAFT_1949938 [Mycena sp. CBHHK59/15]
MAACSVVGCGRTRGDCAPIVALCSRGEERQRGQKLGQRVGTATGRKREQTAGVTAGRGVTRRVEVEGSVARTLEPNMMQPNMLPSSTTSRFLSNVWFGHEFEPLSSAIFDVTFVHVSSYLKYSTRSITQVGLISSGLLNKKHHSESSLPPHFIWRVREQEGRSGARPVQMRSMVAARAPERASKLGELFQESGGRVGQNIEHKRRRAEQRARERGGLGENSSELSSSGEIGISAPQLAYAPKNFLAVKCPSES